MSRYPSPSRWTDDLWRATLTLLAVGLGLHLAWQLIAPLLVPLLILGGLLLVLRLAVGAIGRQDRW